MNEHDSEFMGSVLEQNGFELIQDTHSADLVIINTCSVREKPELKLTHVLNELKSIKRKNPKMVVAVTGCVAQQKPEAIITDYPYVDLVLGPDAVDSFFDHYQALMRTRSTVVDTDFKKSISYKNTLITSASVSSAYVTVMRGCDSFCTYCIVPHVRGREKSRTIDDVYQDVQNLVAKGINNLTLLGQNISRFGLEHKESLSQLLYKLAEVKGIKRLSFLTSHPKAFSAELIKCFEDIKILAPLLHLPCQHGSNKILKEMNRRYTREEYMQIIDKLKASKVWDDLVLTTDVIIGFPGEDDADFNDLMSMLEYAQYDNSFSFIYSPRPGTKSYEQYGSEPDALQRSVYVERLKIYQDRQKEIALQKNSKMIGKVIEVLVEGISFKDENNYSSRTAGSKVVNFVKKEGVILNSGDYVNVRIVKAHPTFLTGELV